MPLAIVTGSGGLIGSESVAHFVEAGLRRHRDRERHAGALLRPGRIDRGPDATGSQSRLRRSFRSLDLDIRDADGRRAASSPSTRPALELVIHTAAQPSHDWAASEPHTDFTVNANGTLNLLEATRRAQARRDVHLHLDQQGLRRPAEPPAARRARDPARAARGPRVLRRHPDDDVDRPLACTRCSAPRRPRPTCSSRSTAATSTCRRSASAAVASPGPNHAGAHAARLPVLPDALHRDRRAATPSTATAASRFATTSTAPTSSAAFDAFHASPRAGGGLQHRRRAREQLLDARGDRRSASRIAGRELDWSLGPDDAHRRPPLVDQRPRPRSRRDYPGVAARVRRSTRSSREIYEANVESWTAVAG